MPLLPFEKGECCNSSMGANRAPRKDLSQSRNSLGYPWALRGGEGLGENRGWGGLTGECGSLDYFAFPLSLAEVAAQG